LTLATGRARRNRYREYGREEKSNGHARQKRKKGDCTSQMIRTQKTGKISHQASILREEAVVVEGKIERERFPLEQFWPSHIFTSVPCGTPLEKACSMIGSVERHRSSLPIRA
jgi:hypothetical protein